ncbi:MAG: hypothetical protein ACOY41_01350 [Pseudomonadota bacterium]
MTDITHINRRELPSSAQLVKATLLALVIAIGVLLTAVLPAEYGIDPTGVGQRLGLTALSGGETSLLPQTDAVAVEPSITAPVSVLDAVWKSPTAYRNDELSVTLAPGEGAEIKALMKSGERFFFAWSAVGGAVNFDLHGEKLQSAADEFTSFWKGRNQTTANGAFEAPFDGTHGWYWRNRGTQAVTVTVKTSGYYEKLYRP